MKSKTLFLSFIVLSIALVIYVIYRPEDTLIIRLLSYTTIQDTIIELRQIASNYSVPHNFVVYSLPGALWLYSTTLLSKNVSCKIFKCRVPLVSIPIIYGIGLEFLQLFHITDGTFDYADIGSMAVAWLLALGFNRDESAIASDWRLPLPALCVAFSYMILILADTF